MARAYFYLIRLGIKSMHSPYLFGGLKKTKQKKQTLFKLYCKILTQVKSYIIQHVKQGWNQEKKFPNSSAPNRPKQIRGDTSTVRKIEQQASKACKKKSTKSYLLTVLKLLMVGNKSSQPVVIHFWWAACKGQAHDKIMPIRIIIQPNISLAINLSKSSSQDQNGQIHIITHWLTRQVVGQS